jgi:hypothetical protein
MTNRSEYSSDTFSLEGVIDIYSFFNSAEIPLTYSGFELKSRLGDGPCLAEYVPVYTALCSAGPIMHSADFLDEARRADQLTSFMDESVDSEDVEQIINDALANNRVFRSPAAVLTWLGY